MHCLRSAALLVLFASPVFADDVLTRADIAEALVFAQGAEITRRVELDLPAGEHSLLIPMRDSADLASIELRGPNGVVFLPPVFVDRILSPEGTFDTVEQANARAAVREAEAAVQDAEDVLARRDADIGGIETQLAYLNALAIGGGEGAAMPTDPAELSAVLETLGGETARLGQVLQSALEARRADEAALDTRLEALEAAELALDALNPVGMETYGIRVDLSAGSAITGPLEIAYLSPDASWRPSYALRLETEAGVLTLARSLILESYGDANWRDVDVRFSTAIPNRRRDPSSVWPEPARIAPPVPETAARDLGESDMIAMAEPVVMAESPAELIIDGLSVVYDYASPVTIGPAGEATLPFDSLSIDVSLENRAVPRRDATAFLVAMGENTSGEVILPGAARFFRDGDLIGSANLPLIAAGAELEMGFGPLDHLRLFWQDLSLNEGDRGIFISENEQVRRIAFGVENVSTQEEEVRLLYAAPFSEQEDLDLSVNFSRSPDETDVDDLRGVGAWNLSVPPQTEARIEMNVELSWPEDMSLNWRP